MRKLVTIVTALKKGDDRISRTITSFEGFADHDVEYLIKMSDDLVDEDVLVVSNLLKSLKIEYRLILQKDDSLYHGLNQALARVDSEFFLVLGAGDKIRQHEFLSIKADLKSLTSNKEIALFAAAIYHEQQKRSVFPRPDLLHRNMFCPHPALFTKTDIAKNLEGFNSTYKIAADYDLTLRIVRELPSVVKSNVVLVDYEGDGVSEREIYETNLEAALIRYRHFGMFS